MFSIKELAHYISLNEIPKSWENCASDISSQYDKKWLDQYNFEEILDYYEFDDSFQSRFFGELHLLKTDERLNYICFIFYYILFLAEDRDYYNIWSWKSTKEIFQKNGSYMIPVVAMLCGSSFHIQNMKERGFDLEQIELQKKNIRLACTSDKSRFQMDGIRFSQMIWGSFFMKGKLIQVGRLQYEIDVRNFSKLDQYFSEEYTYIYIHIPRDSQLLEKDVDESLSRIDGVIKKYYPELQNKKLAYYTESWLLSPELTRILDDNSNIICFQKRFRIVGYEENKNDFLNFVFNCSSDMVSYHDLPSDTKLQRGLKQMLVDDKKLHLGIGLLEKRDN